MKLSKTAVILLRGLNTPTKEKLAGKLKIRMGTLYEYIRLVEDPSIIDGVTNFLREETGLTREELLDGVELGELS